ncbi:LpqB family beta-propeller domain-containing protein [Spongiactinospora sp. TRM90649]|uniref:LpqB family beta-propeller domain-containing protein n=1 Tax=Spongiactinospora sp. TRM90649 TaxID=3031114 RepID=UPI0023F8CFFC|nr:LpqB family beta-propeller domain-containing protein [Spongiactinospora sp. TRM90649]MDF5751373.1 LpqB family beta-propeller domain-containing protein [Spongiactinospora sp. TRM90649]
MNPRRGRPVIGRWARALAVGGVVVACSLLASSCATIPTGSPAEFEQGVQGDPLRKPYVRVIPMPPRPEWKPEQVLMGFLSAMAGVDDPGWSVARSYLTAEAAATWRPNVRVTVYDKQAIPSGSTPAPDAKEATVTLRGTTTGAINDEGKYTAEPQPSGRPFSQDFKLVREPQGWRIAEVPHGLLLTEADVRRSYRTVKLYYLDHSKRGLVVDEVRIPLDPRTDFAESIVKRLLEGPTATLREAVGNALPAGTRLRDIWTEDDKIIVDVNEAAANAISTGAGGGDVDAMAAQIGWTLNQLTERWEVEVRINGEPFYAGTGGVLRVGFDRYGHFDPWLTGGPKDTYVLKDGALSSVGAEGKLTPVPGEAGRTGGKHTEPAMSGLGNRAVAALNEPGDGVDVAFLTEGGQWRRWITGKALTAPSWDRYDRVWSVERLGDRSSRVFRSDGKQQVRVAAPSLEPVGVKALRMARDGVRVAAVVEDDAGTHVRVGVVLERGEPQIANLQTLVTASEGEEIKDIAWRDATTLLILTSSNSGRELTALSVTDGTTEPLKADSRIASITAFEDRVLAGAEGSKTDKDKREILYWDAKGTWQQLTKSHTTSPTLPLG